MRNVHVSNFMLVHFYIFVQTSTSLFSAIAEINQEELLNLDLNQTPPNLVVMR